MDIKYIIQVAHFTRKSEKKPQRKQCSVLKAGSKLEDISIPGIHECRPIGHCVISEKWAFQKL